VSFLRELFSGVKYGGNFILPCLSDKCLAPSLVKLITTKKTVFLIMGALIRYNKNFNY